MQIPMNVPALGGGADPDAPRMLVGNLDRVIPALLGTISDRAILLAAANLVAQGEFSTRNAVKEAFALVDEIQRQAPGWIERRTAAAEATAPEVIRA